MLGGVSLELRVPPPAVALVVALLMWLAARATSAFRVEVPAWNVVAPALALAGVFVVVAGLLEFRRARTTVNPLDPGAASTLVVSGVYRFTRNPMYLGFAIVLFAWAICLAHAVALLGVAGFVAYITRFQIIPEEAALRLIFGAEFDEYAARVRRWI